MLELAHFNLGVAYFRKGDLNEARAALEFEAANDPDHPGTHFILGRVYKQSGFRVPAVLALSRFLLSEPGTKRSSEARDLLEQLFTADVKVDSASSTTVTLDPNASKAEGDFDGADLMMAMSQVTATIDPKSSPKDSPPLQFADLEPPVQRLASTLQMIAESAKQMKNGGFAADFYVPFVVGLASSKQIEVFSRFAYSGAGLPKNDKWLSDHGAELGALQSWVKSFSWPKVSPRIQ